MLILICARQKRNTCYASTMSENRTYSSFSGNFLLFVASCVFWVCFLGGGEQVIKGMASVARPKMKQKVTKEVTTAQQLAGLCRKAITVRQSMSFSRWGGGERTRVLDDYMNP